MFVVLLAGNLKSFISFAGVFFITKVDGNVDVWDLLDRFVVPCLSGRTN